MANPEDHPTSQAFVLELTGHSIDAALIEPLLKRGVLAAVIGGQPGLADLCQSRTARFVRTDLARFEQDQPSINAAEGVVAPASQIGKLRKILGGDCLIGAECGTSRHAAMVAGEAGADYFLFGQRDQLDPALFDLIGWSAGLTTLPAAAMGPLSLEDAQSLRKCGADMLMPSAATDAERCAAIQHLVRGWTADD